MNVADYKNLDNVTMAYNIVEDVKANSTNLILSTSFGHNSAVLLKIVTDIAPKIPVVWVDTGYNTEETYQHCEELQSLLNLNLRIYHPIRSVAHRTALGVNPEPEDPGYDKFVNEIKLEPFKRALAELKPSYWITGIREEETEHRRSLGIQSKAPNGIKKIAPLFYWEEVDLIDFAVKHKLPLVANYQDIAKQNASRECGLHCRL